MAHGQRWALSPLGLFLCAVFLFGTQVLAVSAVLGIDLGTEYIKAALVKPGAPIEIVLTKDSRRKELAAVAFKPGPGTPKPGAFPERAYGSDAAALAARFPGDVYPNLKTLLGVATDDAVVQEYAMLHPALQLESVVDRKTPAFRSNAFAAGEDPWSVEELLAMQLQSVRKNAEAAAGGTFGIRSVVLTVPPFYTVEEKRAVQTAADLAGLKVLALISDGLAVGLHYATSRQFANVDEGGKSVYHLVLDMGAGSTKATVMKFQAKSVKDGGKLSKAVQEVQVVGSRWDRALGGDAFNARIVDDMVTQFVGSDAAKAAAATEKGLRAHGRAMAKLTKEAERLRQILSANANAQGSFEGLYEDVDFKYKISRAEFENMARPHAARLTRVVKEALDAADVDALGLESIILHGGASRTPFVQKVLADAIGSADKLRSNVNSDEAAAMGAGFRAAELSPGFRVKDIRISEGSGYASGLKWAGAGGKVQHQRLWSATSPLSGPTKEVTFANLEDFEVTFYQQIDGEERDTKTATTKNLTATVAELTDRYGCVDGNARAKLALKLRPENGEVVVVKAYAECETEGKEGFVDGVKNLFGFGKKDQEPLKAGDGEASADDAVRDGAASPGSSVATEEASSKDATTSADPSASSPAPSAETGPGAADDKPNKHIVSIPVQLTVEDSGIPRLSKEAVQKCKNRLKAFDASDRSRLAREDALNQLEAFAYKVRDLLDDEFLSACSEEERKQLESRSSHVGDWLYGDGADASQEELKTRLDELRTIVDPVRKRIKESADRPALVNSLQDTLNQTRGFIASVRQQIEEYEAWHSSRSASASSPDTAAVPSPSDQSNDFAGLEDDEDANAPDGDSDKKGPSVEDLIKDHGPVEPLFELAEIEEAERLYKDTLDWLAGAQAVQDKLAATEDPLLTAKDLKEKRDKLIKVTMDLTMRGLKNFEPKVRKYARQDDAKKKNGKKPNSSSGAKTGPDKPDKQQPGNDEGDVAPEKMEKVKVEKGTPDPEKDEL